MTIRTPQVPRPSAGAAGPSVTVPLEPLPEAVPPFVALVRARADELLADLEVWHGHTAHEGARYDAKWHPREAPARASAEPSLTAEVAALRLELRETRERAADRDNLRGLEAGVTGARERLRGFVEGLAFAALAVGAAQSFALPLETFVEAPADAGDARS